MASFSSFQRIVSSDDSDMSDDEKDSNNLVNPTQRGNAENISVESVPQVSSNEDLSEVKPSKMLEIVEKRNNLNKRFSIWSEILMEEELNESINNNLKLKKRRRKPRKSEKDSDNYSFWTKEDFERKFGVKKTNALKKKIKSNELKKDPAHEISRQLKESRLDIIKRIVQVIGEEKARKLTSEVLDIESAGGLMTADGNRRRSPGGALFYLVKNETSISSDQKRSIFCDSEVKINDREMKKTRHNAAKDGQNSALKKRKKKKKKSNKNNKNRTDSI